MTLLGKYREQLDADSVHLLLARVALGDGDLERASSRAARRSASRSSPTVQRTWAEILHRRGQTDEAWEALRDAADHLGAARHRSPLHRLRPLQRSLGRLLRRLRALGHVPVGVGAAVVTAAGRPGRRRMIEP